MKPMSLREIMGTREDLMEHITGRQSEVEDDDGNEDDDEEDEEHMPELDKNTGELVEKPTLARLTDEGRLIRQVMLVEDTDQEAVQEALRQVEGDRLTKVENIGHLILGWENGSLPGLKAEIDRLNKKKKTLENRVMWLKDYVRFNMVEAKEDELVFPLVTVKIAKNPASVEIIDEKIIEDAFTRIVPEVIEVDKKAILDHWRKTEEIPNGVDIITDNTRLVVK